MISCIEMKTTTGSREEAMMIAHHLVGRKLAACVQLLGPITSTYRWKDKVETAQEWLCLIKTQADLFDKVEAAIKRLHSYELPEIIAVPIVKGSREYLSWLENEVR